MKICAWDLETTDLKGLMGRLLCCSFAPIDGHAVGEVYTFRADERRFKTRSKIDDSKLALAIRDELERYDLIIGWNSKLFDAPFLNARLTYAGQRPLRTHFHLDLMYYARGGAMRIGSSKLVNVQKFLRLGEEKTEISWERWQEAALGDRAAMDEVVVHCEQDVKVLGLAYPRMLPYVANLHRAG